MNPLTLVKRTQQINLKEASLGISEEASWHSKFKDSAYIFIGGIPFDLTEGDLLAVFAQYGEIVDVNLVRDKATGKSRGFAFLAYEDQRSTILAVDNLNGAKVLGRVVRVDHVANYRKKEEAEEDPEEEKHKREVRGVCYAFQRGECNRGAACKFSHDEQRNANTGWGSKDADSRWVKAKDFPMDSSRDQNKIRGETKHKSLGKDESSRVEDGDNYKVRSKDYGTYGRDRDQQVKERSPDSRDKESRQKDNRDGRASGRQFTRERTETRSGLKEGERHRRHDGDSSSYVCREGVRTETNSGFKEGERHRRRDRDSSSYVRREDEREHKRRSHR